VCGYSWSAPALSERAHTWISASASGSHHSGSWYSVGRLPTYACQNECSPLAASTASSNVNTPSSSSPSASRLLNASPNNPSRAAAC
jgi:lipocalin